MVERPSEILSKYQVGDSIGHGAFGKVYRALNVETGDFIAIKQIEKAVIQAEHLPGVLRECELLRTLNHPNIVTFIDSHETDEFLFYVMEYVEGGSISKLVKKFGPFPESLLAHYISQVLKGLHYLHSQGVIHRDIKGENVLVTKQGTVKLVDFGSCTYQAMDKMLTVVGTPFWMAPEIIEMDGSARNTACDIWSLGCTIIELTTGFPPFWELGPMPAMFAMVNQEHPPLPTVISESLQDFLLLCFTKEIQRRPTAAQLLEHPWISTALKKAEKIDFNLNGLSSPEQNESLENTMKQLQMENENLRSTVKSLKQHMLKMMKDQKLYRAKIESLEGELIAARTKLMHSPVGENSPELRRRALAPASVPLGNSGPSSNGTYLSAGAMASGPLGASVSADRLFSPPKTRAASITSKPLPPPPSASNVASVPTAPNGTVKYAPKLGSTRLNIDTTAGQQLANGVRSTQSSPRNETQEDNLYMDTRLRSSSEPIPSPFMNEPAEQQIISPRGNPAVQTGSVSSPRNSPQIRCGNCTGCIEDGVCLHRLANFALSPPLRIETSTRALNFNTHPVSPRAQQRAATYTSAAHHSYSNFATPRTVNPQATFSTPNLPLYTQEQGRVSPSSSSAIPHQLFSPSSLPSSSSSAPAQMLSPSSSSSSSPSSQMFSPPPSSSSSSFSPPSTANLTLKPGDKCHVRSSSNTWHRATVEAVTNNRRSAIVVYKATGKREEVSFDNILTEEEGKRKKMEKEKEKENTGKRKHVATIFQNKQP